MINIKNIRMAGFAAILSFAANDGMAQTKIDVMSDVHIMNPELMKKDGEAFAEYIRNDRKMLKLGPQLLDEYGSRVKASP